MQNELIMKHRTDKLHRVVTTVISAVFALWAFLLPAWSIAQFQRMGIPAGTALELGGKSTATRIGSMTARCMDVNRSTPWKWASYSEVLTSPASAKVKVGAQSMSLQEALQNKVLAVRSEGDYRSLQFENLTDLPVRIESDGVVFGQRKETITDIEGGIEILRSADPDQMGIWSTNGEARVGYLQQLLKDAGHYGGAVDGIDGPLTREAVVGFERARHLPETGDWQNLIDHLDNEEHALGYALEVRKSNLGIDLLTMRETADGSAFVVRGVGADGDPQEWMGTDLRELAQWIENGSAVRTGRDIYLETALDEARRDAFGASLQAHFDDIASGTRLITHAPDRSFFSSQKDVFKRGVEVTEDSFSPVTEITDGPYAGMYEGAFEARTNEDSWMTTHILSKTKDLVVEVLARCRQLLTGNPTKAPDAQLSLASIVNMARREIAKAHNVPIDEVKSLVQTDFSGWQILEVPIERQGPVLWFDEVLDEPMASLAHSLGAACTKRERSRIPTE